MIKVRQSTRYYCWRWNIDQRNQLKSKETLYISSYLDPIVTVASSYKELRNLEHLKVKMWKTVANAGSWQCVIFGRPIYAALQLQSRSQDVYIWNDLQLESWNQDVFIWNYRHRVDQVLGFNVAKLGLSVLS